MVDKGKVRRKRPIDEDYLDLILEFPVRPIRNSTEHHSAQAILDRIVGRPRMTRGQSDYIAGLAHFVEEYERQRFRKLFAKSTPLDLLKHLLDANDMNTSDLGDILGSRGLASEVLNGKRGLSKRLIRKLSDRFGVDPGLFLDA